jgi:hypothetical protein
MARIGLRPHPQQPEQQRRVSGRAWAHGSRKGQLIVWERRLYVAAAVVVVAETGNRKRS